MDLLKYLCAPKVLQITVWNPLVKEDSFLQKIPFKQVCFYLESMFYIVQLASVST
jgi:hypothetical protein